MDYGTTIFLLTGALVSVAQTHQYHFVSVPLNWTEAQHFCREAYTDLATIENIANISAVLTTTSNYSGQAWIGLYDDLVNGWRWSLNDSSFDGRGESGFTNWKTGYPLRGQLNCTVLFGGRGTWENLNCSLRRPFICYTGMVYGTFIKINQQLNWTKAQRYCRENYIDLASIPSELDNAVVTNISSEDSVWIGLHRESLWSDGSSSLFRHWAFGEPDSVGEKCITTALHGSGEWSDRSCSLTFPFICHSTSRFLSVADSFTSVGQDESSITLSWNTLNNVSFILQFNGTKINISAPDGDGQVAYTVSSLTAGTNYTFTLFSVFAGVRSSGVNVTAVTAPANADRFRSTGQNETSITLQWNNVINTTGFVLQFNGEEKNIAAPERHGRVNYTVSCLTAGTTYTFSLFSVFYNVRSSGVNVTAATRKQLYHVVGLDLKLKSLVNLSDSDIESALFELLSLYGLTPPVLSMKVKNVKP